MAYADEVLADSPAGYWRLGEPSGATAFDETANANDGTYTLTAYGEPGLIGDDPDTSVRLDRALAGERVEVPDDATLDFGDTFTLECWFKRETISETMGLLDKGSNGFFLIIASDNHLMFGKRGVTVITDGPTITDVSSPHHVVVTKNGATTKVYLDGVDVTPSVTNDTIANTAAVLFIGQTIGGNEYWDGWLDEVAVYPTALSAGRVLAHYNAGAIVLPVPTLNTLVQSNMRS